MDVVLDEFLSSIKGSYSHGYFYMYLSSRYDKDLSKLTVSDLGTFFHEYVHFLQNITTLWSIKAGITSNNVMCSLFTATQKAKLIRIPFDFQLDTSTKLELDFLNRARGCTGDDKFKNWMIDSSKPIGISVFQDNSQHWPIPLKKVFLDVTFQDGRKEVIQLGSTIIVESMAALCQSLIDPSAEHNDVPYNVVQILANQKYPKIASDKKKLICICYLALFSLDPGWYLMDTMVYAEHNELSGFELFDDFVNNTVLRVNGQGVKVVDFFDYIIDGYIQSIEGLIGIKTDYLKELLNSVRLSKQQAPLISILNDTRPLGVEHIQTLVNYLSVPFITDSSEQYYFPGTTTSPNGSGDVAMLVGFNKLFDFLVKPRYGFENICPFVSICDHNHDKCYTEPWTETNCMIEPALKKVGVYGKPITIDIK